MLSIIFAAVGKSKEIERQVQTLWRVSILWRRLQLPTKWEFALWFYTWPGIEFTGEPDLPEKDSCQRFLGWTQAGALTAPGASEILWNSQRFAFLPRTGRLPS